VARRGLAQPLPGYLPIVAHPASSPAAARWQKGRQRRKKFKMQPARRFVFVAADLSKIEDCRAVIAKADAEFGRVDVLVNAAAITDRGHHHRHVA